MLLGMAPCPYVHCLHPGVSGYQVGQGRLVCLNSFCEPKMAAVLYSSRGVEMALSMSRSSDQGVIM